MEPVAIHVAHAPEFFRRGGRAGHKSAEARATVAPGTAGRLRRKKIEAGGPVSSVGPPTLGRRVLSPTLETVLPPLLPFRRRWCPRADGALLYVAGGAQSLWRRGAREQLRRAVGGGRSRRWPRAAGRARRRRMGWAAAGTWFWRGTGIVEVSPPCLIRSGSAARRRVAAWSLGASARGVRKAESSRWAANPRRYSTCAHHQVGSCAPQLVGGATPAPPAGRAAGSSVGWGGPS